MTLRPPGARSRDFLLGHAPAAPAASLSYPGHLTYGTFLPSCPDSSHIPPGHPASLSHCPPLAAVRCICLTTATGRPVPSASGYLSQRARPHGPPLHTTGAVHTGLTLPDPTRSRDPRLHGARAPEPKAIVDVPGLHQGVTKPPATLGARQWHHSQMLPGGAGASRNHGGPGRHAATSTRLGKHLGVFASPSSSSEGTQRDEPAQAGGGLPHTYPAAMSSDPFGQLIRSGMQLIRSGMSRDTHIIPQNGRKRTQSPVQGGRGGL